MNNLRDDAVEAALRPKRLADYIGQSQAKARIDIAIRAAKQRGEALDHVLLHGPPGLGKTTLARIIANELGVGIKTSSGPILEKKADATAILIGLGPRDVFFVDEVHRLDAGVEEVFYPAMEDFRLDLMVKGNTFPFDLQKFTLIGATTRPGMVTPPMRARFGITIHLEFYSPDDLAVIIMASAQILKTAIDVDAALEMAKRCRGTPRIANRLLKRARDMAQVQTDGRITHAVACRTLGLEGIDEHGMDMTDRKIITTLLERGTTVGLNTLGAITNEDEGTIAEVYEPYLMQLGLMDRTPRGRMATEKASRLFGIPMKQKYISLF